MPKSRVASAKKSGAKKADAPAAPPPVLKRINTVAALERHVTSHPGAALVVVVSPLTASATDAVIAALEQLNGNRPPQLAEANLTVVYALPSTAEVCQALDVTAVPLVRGYAYGEVVGEFTGDNAEKLQLMALLAAKAAQDRATRMAEEEEQQRQAAAADGQQGDEGMAAAV